VLDRYSFVERSSRSGKGQSGTIYSNASGLGRTSSTDRTYKCWYEVSSH